MCTFIVVDMVLLAEDLEDIELLCSYWTKLNSSWLTLVVYVQSQPHKFSLLYPL